MSLSIEAGGRSLKGEVSMRMVSRGLAVVGAGMVTLNLIAAAADGPTTVSGIRTTPQSRAAYLAHATIWHDPSALSPTDVFEGPSGALPYTFE
jgi:hypothetical protein